MRMRNLYVFRPFRTCFNENNAAEAMKTIDFKFRKKREKNYALQLRVKAIIMGYEQKHIME